MNFSLRPYTFLSFALLLQNGGECVRAYVYSLSNEMRGWRDSQSGRSAIDMLCDVLTRLLDPDGDEGNSAFVGRLIFSTITHLGGSLGERVPSLLHAVLGRLQSVEQAHVQQVRLLPTKLDGQPFHRCCFLFCFTNRRW